MKIAFIKTFLHNKQRYSHSVTFDYLIASINEAKLSVNCVICYSYEDIIRENPNIVCISSATESYLEAIKLTNQCSDRFVIIGGTHLTAVPKTLPEYAECGILGEGEVTIVEVLKNLLEGKYGQNRHKIQGICYWTENGIQINEARKPLKMNNLPIPIHSNIKYDFGDAVALLTTRGCVNKCRHCSEQKIWKPFRMLSARKIVDIMKMHYKKSGKTDFVFLDDISFFNLRRITEIRDILKVEGLLGTLKICKGSVNSELVTEPIVKVLKELGLKLAGFGLESASPRILYEMKAGKVKVEDFIKCMKLFGQYGIRNGASTVWGYPGETLDDMKKTQDFLYRWNGRNKFFSFEQYVCQPLPGSDLWDKFLKEGKVSLDMDFSKMRIKPNFTDKDWYYCNEEYVPRDKFQKFFQGVQKGLKQIRKQGWKDA